MSEPPVKPSDGQPPRRAYRTPKRDRRAAQTRRTIRDAAEALFLRDGYTRTTMTAIAARAGVSEKTMYLVYATKANLLREVIQVAVRGDEARATLADRPEWRAVMAGPIDEVFKRFAALNTALMVRTAPIIALAESAAATDPELAKYRDRAHATSRADLAALATELKRRGALAPGVSEQDAADTIYALATDVTVYLRLTHDCGWSDDRYTHLIACALTATLSLD
jgi:AcrR family transcriptional regulator